MLKRLGVTTIASMLILVGSVFATSNLINYEGKVEAIKNGFHTCVFAIYRSQTGGPPIWLETHNDIQVVGGKFRVMLGEISPIPDSVRNGPTWLETKLDGKAGVGRKPIGGGYLLESITKLAWLEGTQTVASRPLSPPAATDEIADGAVTTSKIGDGNVTGSKIADGSVTASKIQNSAVLLETETNGSDVDWTVPTVWTDVPGSSVTINPSFTSIVWIAWIGNVGVVNLSNAQYGILTHLVIDGSIESHTEFLHRTGAQGQLYPWLGASIVAFKELEPGTHTITVQAQSQVATWGHITPCKLSVIVFKK